MKLIKVEHDYNCDGCLFAVKDDCLLNTIQKAQKNKVDLDCTVNNKNYIFKLEDEQT